MKYNWKILSRVAIIYVSLCAISYGLFLYQTEKYKKIDITFFYPDVMEQSAFVEFIRKNFVQEYGNMIQLGKSCYRLTLTNLSGSSPVVNYNNTEATGVSFKKLMVDKSIEAGVSVEDQKRLIFSTPICKFLVNNPFAVRNRALVFIFLFNIINAILLFYGFQLVTLKNKDN